MFCSLISGKRILCTDVHASQDVGVFGCGTAITDRKFHKTIEGPKIEGKVATHIQFFPC